MTLSACVNWPLLWPKGQIHLGAGDTTPQTRPPVVPAPSHGKNAAMLPDLPDIPMLEIPRHKLRTTTTTTTVHLPKSISTLPNMGTLTSCAGLFLKNPTKTIAI